MNILFQEVLSVEVCNLRVNLDVVWDIIRRDLAPLKRQISDVLSNLD